VTVCARCRAVKPNVAARHTPLRTAVCDACWDAAQLEPGVNDNPRATRSQTPKRTGRRRLSRARRRQRCFGLTRPGTYARIPAWWSREHWRSELLADLQSDKVRELRASVGHRGPVSVRACYAVARAVSACADTRTGRNAMPGTDALIAKPDQLDPDDPAYYAHLVAATGYSRSTVQKALRVLEARGWLVRVRAGKNWLKKAERLEVHESGSPARCRRNVWACTIPPHLRGQRAAWSHNDTRADGVVDNSANPAAHADPGCALPTTLRVSGSSPVSSMNIFKPQQTSRNAPSGRPPTKETPQKRAYRADQRCVRLAKDLRASIYWLRDVPHQRIMPALDRFARAGWTALDVQKALDGVLSARRWTVPSDQPTGTTAGRVRQYPLRCPWGYLAMLLRAIDPADLAVDREHERSLLRRVEPADYQRLLLDGPRCPHGQPGGHIPSPIRGIRACPACRRHGHQVDRSGD
jgi:hypothetical protein